MDIKKYFEDSEGTGILATSDSEGNVDLAIYSRPYIIDENKIAFSMLERTTYQNVLSNPKAAYMFIEEGKGYKGTRLYLKMAGEETDAKVIKEIKAQRIRKHESKTDSVRHFVYFEIENVRPLSG
ncbi:MAG: pyridoxamine 5'-phosphate oxidase family protein [Sedimentisphaerales bacterium]|nr:pyridoxamine 5'-phosphate oxidase family protein [Sedimentisphaerales bacterium]